jgi:hypothetical protein
MKTVTFDGQSSSFYSFLMLKNQGEEFPIMQIRGETWR